LAEKKPATRKGVEVPVADEGEVTIGTHNARNDLISQISRQTEHDQMLGDDTDEVEPTPTPQEPAQSAEPPSASDDPEAEPATPVAGAAEEPKPTEPKDPAPGAEDEFLSLDAIGKKRVRLKVDGEDRVITLEEALRDVQKKGAADRRLEEATRLLNETKEITQKAVAAQPPQGAEPMQPPLDEDVAAMVRAIRTGTEPEANLAVNHWQQQLREKATLPAANVRDIVNDAIDFRNAAEWVKTEYADLWADERLGNIFADLDYRQVQAQDKRAYRERYKEIGDGLREWRDSIAESVIRSKPAQTLDEKRERKAAAVTTPTAASAKDVLPPADENEEPNAQDVIAGIAKARGQSLRG
jgi:hypothetical protein